MGTDDLLEAATDSNLRHLLAPASVAIIGASNDPAKIGGRPLSFLRRGGFGGGIYPINPNSDVVQGLPAYPTIKAIPDDVEVAIVAVASSQVEGVLSECVSCGVGAVIVFSAGFAESGSGGQSVQERLRQIVRAGGTRLLGPNSLGAFTPSAGWYGTFATALDVAPAMPGSIGVATQSGAVGSYLYALLAARHSGLSSFIATGNEADVTLADAMDVLIEDPATSQIAITFDNIRDGDEFVGALERAAEAGKPVVALTMGATEAGSRAVSSHTGALASNDALVRAVARQYGVELADSLTELADLAVSLSSPVRPRSDRTAVITTSGGVGVLIADELSRANVRLPRLSERARDRITELLPLSSGDNPVDTSTQIMADFSLLTEVLDVVLTEDECDNVLLFLAHIGRNRDHFGALRDALFAARGRHPDKVFALSMLSGPGLDRQLREHGFLTFEDPTTAARVLARIAGHRRPGRSPSRCAIPHAGGDLTGQVLDELEAADLLRANGLPILSAARASSAGEAVDAAERIGYPVVVKGVARGVLHKSDLGLVKLNLANAAEVTNACYEIERAAQADSSGPAGVLDGFAVSAMIGGGVEVVAGVHNDPVFGPMVMVGQGGVLVEAVGDVEFGRAPLSGAQAGALVDRTRVAALLAGGRGRPPVDRATLVDTLVRLGDFGVTHRHDLLGVEINPLLIRADGVFGLDAVVLTRPART